MTRVRLKRRFKQSFCGQASLDRCLGYVTNQIELTGMAI